MLHKDYATELSELFGLNFLNDGDKLILEVFHKIIEGEFIMLYISEFTFP